MSYTLEPQGESVKLTVLHDKQKRDVDVTLAALKEEGDKGESSSSDDGPSAVPQGRTSALGIGVQEEDGHVIVGRVASGGEHGVHDAIEIRL